MADLNEGHICDQSRPKEPRKPLIRQCDVESCLRLGENIAKRRIYGGSRKGNREGNIVYRIWEIEGEDENDDEDD